MRTTARLTSLIAVAAVATGTLAAAGTAGALPVGPSDGLRHYVKTLRCPSADPWGGPRLPITVDVYNKVRFPSDGLRAPAIELIANDSRTPGLFPGLQDYTVRTTVTWHNQRTGRTGKVTVPSRSERAEWQAVLHPGTGPVRFTVHQKIGAMVFVPMVNAQYSSCRGSAQSS
ncbi:hypothetical protein [Gordonia sp. VNK21]|uniref:hypothetical protein n=1 Tax=Gordonia sp. VNK21 TaxID=3382483 RepID=UPI0038D4940B